MNDAPRYQRHPEAEPVPSDEKTDDLDEMDVDQLIEHIILDAYGDETYWSFRQTFQVRRG